MSLGLPNFFSNWIPRAANCKAIFSSKHDFPASDESISTSFVPDDRKYKNTVTKRPKKD
jgi:hypothetical protein